MHRTLRTVLLAALCLAAEPSTLAIAQANPAASRPLTLSAFVGASGVYTGIDSGRNLSLTGGADLAFLPYRRFQPALEYRGTFAIDQGSIDSQKNQLLGLKLTYPLKHLRPYATILFGRGEITYLGNGIQVPGKPIYYLLSSSNVLSTGAGIDLALSPSFAFKADVQLQRYATPVTTSGHILSAPITLGLNYTFHLTRHPKK